MRLGIKGKQVLYVTSTVGLFVVAVSLLYLTQLARVRLTESHARAEMLAQTLFYRAREVVIEGADPYAQLRADAGLRSILASSLGVKNVLFAAVVDTHGTLIAKDPVLQDTVLPDPVDLAALLAQSPFAQLRAIYQGQGRNFEVRQPLLIGDREIGSIRIGVSTLLIRGDLDESLRFALGVVAVTVALAMVVSMLLAQLILRPIHVIRSGLTRLGRGESGVRLDIGSDDEFGELGHSFNTVSAQLSADRSQMAGQMAHLESAVEHLEDAVAIVSPTAHVLFTNPAARRLFPDAATGASIDGLMPAGHPLRQLFEQTLASGQAYGPIAANLEGSERLILGHPVNDADGTLMGIMMIVRNLEYLSQVQSTVRYSRKLAALGRLSAGVAHEVKNPLNAMMIHLELLRQQLNPRVVGAGRAAGVARSSPVGSVANVANVANVASVVNVANVASVANVAGVATVATVAPAKTLPPPAMSDALQHIDVIAGEIRRLDDVVQGFLKFARPEDLKLQPIQLHELLQDLIPVLKPEADRAGVTLVLEGGDVPDVNGDPSMLKQAFLNLGLNACQAMPRGGTLRMHCEGARSHRVAVSFTDTGVGISPEHLKRIFDLYFTTKPKGSGIGLSMVFRTVQMHDGEIEVQSTPGVGTTFTVTLPQA